MQGVTVKAYETQPQLTPDELFYFEAFNILSSAGYADISAYCKDYGLTVDERADLIAVIMILRKHARKAVHANSRAND